MAPDFETFISTAWDEHGDHPQAVADRLAQSIHVVANATHARRFAALVGHVFGEHLGQWQAGIVVLEALRAGAAAPTNAGDVDALAGPIAALRFAQGDPAAVAALPAEHRIAALATAATALVVQGDRARGLAAYARAVRLAEDHQPAMPSTSPAIRALAIAGNNVAVELERKAGRSAAETAGMIDAARCALRYWQRAGTWLEEERAEYRLARSLLQAGARDAAVASAARCVQICTRNDAPPFELFFACAALALTHHAAGDPGASTMARAAALAAYARIDPGEQQYCADDLRELNGAAASHSNGAE